MGYKLYFSLARRASSKFAEFQTAELKDSFVRALNKDRDYVRCYSKYSDASGQERKDLAFETDMIQYRFYKRWALEHQL